MTVDSKIEVFFGKLLKGGVIFDPKNYIADFVGFKAVYFGHKFWKKCPKRGGEGGVIANPKNFIANLRILNGFSGKKRNVISKKGRGGGSRPFGSFPKKHPFLGRRSSLIPKV